MLKRFACSFLAVLAFPAAAFASGEAARYWPAWRGPSHDGVSPQGDPPIVWSETQNVRFKVAIPGRSLSSPVVWGDRVFVMTAVAVDDAAYAASREAAADRAERGEWPPEVAPVEQRFLLLALSRDDGRVLWQREATRRAPHESHYVDSGWSTASPVTDGRRVFAHFGSNGTYAFDVDGKPLWQIDLGDMTTRNSFGEGSSPALHDDTLVINWDHEGPSFLVALDAATGEPRWKVERPDEVTSWSTPLVVQHGGRAQVVVSSTGRSRGYDLETGRELWSLAGMTTNVIPSPVHRDGVVYLTSGFRGAMLQAVDLARATGPLEESNAVRWSHERDTPYVPSPLLYDDSIYFLKGNKNILSVLDADTGKPRYEIKRLDALGDVWASPVAAAGRVYVFDRDGKAVVLRHGPSFELLAENELDGTVNGSPAIAGGEIFVQTREHLYCIARDGAKSVR
ncbi:MAG TPA: PQQ-binding-like beta-propeller repeat protein [Candidatus Polarisedimenticolaceae bacterium]|nr:PQQ-binding-like beta-propeller repeat protein [Candidatus Polarisedimenticolaceae bacterium]